MKLNHLALDKNSLEPAPVQSLVNEARLERIIISAVDGVGICATNMDIEGSVLERVLLIESKLEKLSLSDVELKACDLSAARCSESSLIRVLIKGGRMTGIDLSRSTLKDVVLEDCKLDMANFRYAKLNRVQFINCMLTETDFYAAELQDIAFQNCHLEKVEFGQCKIRHVDVRTSQLFDLRGWQFLKGLKIDSMQLAATAPQLAAELGVLVED